MIRSRPPVTTNSPDRGGILRQVFNQDAELTQRHLATPELRDHIPPVVTYQVGLNVLRVIP